MDKYNSIENLYREPDVLLYKLVVLEKLHGTNVRFCKKEDGTVCVGSRNNIIFDGNQYNKEFDSYGFYSWFQENINAESLPIGLTFYGEFFGSGIQKGVKYFPNDTKSFACFDIKEKGEYKNWDEVVSICNSLNLTLVPEVGRGSFNKEKLDELINKPSPWAENQGVYSIQEGVVIKPLEEQLNRFGRRIIAKHKNEKFKEKHKAPKKKKEQSVAFLEGQSYCTYARVENAIDKLRQEISEEIDMKHMPHLLKIVSQDIQKDAELPETKAERKRFMKGAQSLVAKHLREWLLKDV